MSNQITTGVKITVDASDIQNKFTKSVDQLNASLSKNQRALGLVYNEQGLLTNALGQTVEGLSQSAIKLGQYVDELGRVRTFQGGFIDGLSKTQIELGHYADELGNVYNRFGELIGQTEKARKAQEEEAKAAERAASANAASAKALRDSLSHTAEGISKVAGQFAIFQQLLQTSGASSTAFGDSVAKTANAISVATGSFKASMEFLNGLAEATRTVPALFASTATAAKVAAPAVATLGTEAAATGVAFSAMGGPITLAISAVAASTAGLLSMKASEPNVVKVSDSFEELEKKAKQAGTTIKSVNDALKVGAFADSSSELDAAKAKIEKAEADLKEANKKYQQAVERSNKANTYSGGMIYVKPKKEDYTGKAEADWKNAVAEYNDVAAKYVAQAREAQKTEEDKLKEQRRAYSELLKKAEKLGKDKDADVFRRQIQMLDGKILEGRKKEAEEAQRKAKEIEEKAKKDREAFLSSVGVASYLKKNEEATKSSVESVEAYKSKLAEWSKLAEEGKLSASELSAAEKGLADDFRAALEKRIGTALVDGQEKTVDAFAELADALKAGAINQAQYDATKAALEKKELDAIASRLGVSFEAPQTDDYASKTKELADLLEQGKITQEQYNEATKQLKDKARDALGVGEEQTTTSAYNKRLRELDDAYRKGIIEKKDRDRLENEAKTQLAKTVGASAEALKEYEKRRAKAEKDYADGLIDEAERDRRLKNATRKLEKARDDAAKKAELEQKKQGTRNALGVDSLMESLKSPLQKYRETLGEIADALKTHAINAREADALRERAADAYLQTLADDANALGASAPSGGKRNEIARSYSNGSEDLYLAQVRNAQSGYQSTIQETTAKIQQTAAESLNVANQSAYYLKELVDAVGVAPVWG